MPAHHLRRAPTRAGRVLPAAVIFLAAACSDGSGPDLDDGTAVTGRVFTLDGGNPSGLVFAVKGLAGRRSGTIASDGSFRVVTELTGDSIDYVVEANSRYHAALIRAPAGTTPDLRIVLVPQHWTIDRGTYNGQVIQISPDAAFQPPCTNLTDTNCDGFYPRVWTSGFKLWPATALPIRLAFDRVRSNQSITPVDSIDFWTIVSKMNADFGSQLFRPVRYDELTILSDGRADRAVLVRVDTTLTGFGAWTNWWWDGAGDLTAGVVRPARATYLRSVALMTHELLHTQGFKHSCSWPTVMGGYGCSSFQGLSPTDVAHAHVALRMRDLQRQTGAPHGLIAALQGQRGSTLAAPLFSAPELARLRLLRSDGLGEPAGDHAH